MQMRTKLHCVTPLEQGGTWRGERKMKGLETKPLLLTLHCSHNAWLWLALPWQSVKNCQNAPAAYGSSIWEKESHWMRLIDLKDDKNFTLQNRWVAREESKVWALSLVPNYFSLSRPHLAFLMWGDTMYFHMHLHFARSTIPEGNWGTTHSLP